MSFVERSREDFGIDPLPRQVDGFQNADSMLDEEVRSIMIQSSWLAGDVVYTDGSLHPTSKESGGHLTVSMQPTEEQIRQTGGFQTPSLTSPTEKGVESNGGFTSSPVASNGSNDLLAEYARSRAVSRSPLKRSLMPQFSNDRPDNYRLRDRSGSLLSEQRPVLELNEEQSNETSKAMLVYEDDWVTEVSLTEEETLQAADLERQTNEAVMGQMAALRTYDWVSNTFGRGSSITPPLQMLSASVAGDEEHKSVSSDFASSENAWIDKKLQDNDKNGENPFQTPLNKRSSHRTTFDLPIERSFSPDSSVVVMATARDRQLSPCAYRSRIEADLLFNSLQQEVSTKQEPLKRSNEPETECEYLSRLSETPRDG